MTLLLVPMHSWEVFIFAWFNIFQFSEYIPVIYDLLSAEQNQTVAFASNIPEYIDIDRNNQKLMSCRHITLNL